MAEESPRTPRWVWLLILTLAALQPLVHALTLYFPPQGTVPTGLGIPDSALFLYSMDMLRTGFHSSYATCLSTVGDASIHFYGVPLLWLYGILGLAVGALPGEAYLYYGLVNGLGAGLYLWVVYRFLVRITPKHASPAFVLFALSAGPGGLLYLAAGGLGWHAHPLFEPYFLRLGVYDVMEGPHFNPVLYFPRLYYTLSLASCLGGLAAAMGYIRQHETRWPWGWSVAIALGTFLNARFGAFTLGLFVLFLTCHWSQAGRGVWSRRLGVALLAFCAPALLGMTLAGTLIRLDPATLQNLQDSGTMAMWFSPFVIVTWLHWVGAGPVILFGARRAPAPVRLLLGAGLGYLVAYAAAYLCYQTYHGNLLIGRDGSVASSISDASLLGAVAGLLVAWRCAPLCAKAGRSTANPMVSWLLLWLVGYTALALSGFGQGWFLRFGPQRIQVFLWLPLCTLAAMGLATWTPRWRRGAYGILITCGVTAIVVATFLFQSPLGRVDAHGPYAALHAEIMHENDGHLMAALGDGVVLAPSPAGDAIVQRSGNSVVFGIGSFNLSDRPYAELEKVTARFFAPETPETERRAIAETWCVAWVYCPHTWPVAPETVEQLKSSPWLEEVAQGGVGTLFHVNMKP